MAMRRLLLPRQQRIHFRDESNSRKQRIIETVLSLNITADVYLTALTNDEVAVRQRCIASMTVVAAPQQVREIVLEQDVSMLAHDRRAMATAMRSWKSDPRPEYRWERARDNPLLWVPDAIAWCWAAKKGPWHSRVSSIVTEHRL